MENKEVNLLLFFHSTFQNVTVVFFHTSIKIRRYECSHACAFFNGNDNLLKFSFYLTSDGTFQQGLVLLYSITVLN